MKATPAEVVQPTPVRPSAPPVVPDAAWFAAMARLRVNAQIRKVGDKLAELNPGFDPNLQRLEHFRLTRTEGGPKTYEITSLLICTDKVANVSPVAALTKLKSLECRGSAPGKGQLVDLSPLRHMQHLRVLDCRRNPIADFAVLKDVPLSHIWCDKPEQHRAELQQIPTLRRINDKAVPWKASAKQR